MPKRPNVKVKNGILLEFCNIRVIVSGNLGFLGVYYGEE